jgi:hypothetical protein
MHMPMTVTSSPPNVSPHHSPGRAGPKLARAACALPPCQHLTVSAQGNPTQTRPVCRPLSSHLPSSARPQPPRSPTTTPSPARALTITTAMTSPTTSTPSSTMPPPPRPTTSPVPVFAPKPLRLPQSYLPQRSVLLPQRTPSPRTSRSRSSSTAEPTGERLYRYFTPHPRPTTIGAVADPELLLKSRPPEP